MQQLPNNCRAGKMSVFPKNWNTIKANINLKWYIKYRFYDDNLNKSKQVVLKGMNMLIRLAEKQAAVKTQLKDEQEMLERGYNPITDNLPACIENHPVKEPDPEPEEDLTETTPFLEALLFGRAMIKCSKHTHEDLDSILKYVRIAILTLGYDRLPIKEVRRRHLISVLNKCGEIKLSWRKHLIAKYPSKKIVENWTAATFNKYRTHLSMIYRQLFKMEAVEANLCEAIDLEKYIKKAPNTLTPEEVKEVNDHIFKFDYNFWRFIQIFFHSGARETEIMRVKKEDVDLTNQRVKLLIQKGTSYREEWRMIKTVAIPLWTEVYNEAKLGQVIFSKGLKPGNHTIRTEQIPRRWKTHVKAKLGITSDFYRLKHLNTTQVTDAISAQLIAVAEAEKQAAKMNGHTSTAMVRSIYDTKNKIRRSELIKEVKNKFA